MFNNLKNIIFLYIRLVVYLDSLLFNILFPNPNNLVKKYPMPKNVFKSNACRRTVHLIYKSQCFYLKILYKHCAFWFPTVREFRRGFLQLDTMYFKYDFLLFKEYGNLNLATFF